jgi:hypothetical protein
MTTIGGIYELLETQPLTDILMVGSVDYDPAYKAERFDMLFHNIYLQFGDRFLRCTSLHKYSLQLEIVDGISPDNTEGAFCVGSVYTLLVKHSDQNRLVTSFTAFIDEGSDFEMATVRCAAFLLGFPDRVGDQDLVFLDPWNTYGIRIGTKQLMDEWVRDNATPGDEYPPGTRYEKHDWNRSA